MTSIEAMALNFMILAVYIAVLACAYYLRRIGDILERWHDHR